MAEYKYIHHYRKILYGNIPNESLEKISQLAMNAGNPFESDYYAIQWFKINYNAILRKEERWVVYFKNRDTYTNFMLTWM